MFNSNFNNNFYPSQYGQYNPQYSPYNTDTFGEYNQTPYVQGMNVPMPQPLPGNMTASSLYPLESSTATPGLSTPLYARYAGGGAVNQNMLPGIAELIRRQGEGGDTILAHINPQEAAILGHTTGGDINPITGLPQYGFFNKPWKAIKGSIGKVGGAVIGNMILPGIGGIIGGALGGGAQHAMRGKKFGEGALQGAITGATLPMFSSIGGAGASALGFNTAGSALSNYGAQNAILPAIGRMFPAAEGVTSTLSGFDPFSATGGGGSTIGSGSGITSSLSDILSSTEKGGVLTAGAGGGTAPAAANSGLSGWLSSFLKPKNLLTAVSVAGNLMNRPKEESPESKAEKEKRYMRALRPSEADLAEERRIALAREQARRYIERNKFLPEERFMVNPIHRKVNTPEEARQRGRWIEYYDNPEYAGEPMNNFYKEGGAVKPQISYEMEEIDYPSGIGRYIEGHTKGQEDKIPAYLSDGEFVIPADVVSHMGDGNNNAGAKVFYDLIGNIRKDKGQKNQLPPKAKPLTHYMNRR